IQQFRSQNAGALLGYLALHCNRSHPRAELIKLLWSDCEPALARQRLRVELASLRKDLEPLAVPAGAVIVVDRFSVQLNPAAVATDVVQFEAELQASARAQTSSERLRCLTRAVEGYRGELLPGFHQEWVLSERQRLAGSFLQALRQLMAIEEEAGHLPRAL